MNINGVEEPPTARVEGVSRRGFAPFWSTPSWEKNLELFPGEQTVSGGIIYSILQTVKQQQHGLCAACAVDIRTWLCFLELSPCLFLGGGSDLHFLPPPPSRVSRGKLPETSWAAADDDEYDTLGVVNLPPHSRRIKLSWPHRRRGRGKRSFTFANCCLYGGL